MFVRSWYLVFLADLVISKCPEYIFKRIPFQNELVNNYLDSINGLSLKECGQKCVITDTCKSFAYKPALDNITVSECYVFSLRVWAGQNSTAKPGLVNYWKLAESCPVESGYIYNSTYNVCYKPYLNDTERQNWFKAQKQCENDGGVLYMANSAEKWEILYSMYADVTYPAFTRVNFGAMDFYFEGRWRWLDGSSMEGFWTKGEPNNKNDSEGCACFTWNKDPDPLAIDVKCWPKRLFVCEIPVHQTETQND